MRNFTLVAISLFALSVSAAEPLTVPQGYPGAEDENELQIQAALPETLLRVDSRSLQRKVFKDLYNQDLGDTTHEESQED